MTLAPARDDRPGLLSRARARVRAWVRESRRIARGRARGRAMDGFAGGCVEVCCYALPWLLPVGQWLILACAAQQRVPDMDGLAGACEWWAPA